MNPSNSKIFFTHLYIKLATTRANLTMTKFTKKFSLHLSYNLPWIHVFFPVPYHFLRKQVTCPIPSIDKRFISPKWSRQLHIHGDIKQTKHGSQQLRTKTWNVHNHQLPCYTDSRSIAHSCYRPSCCNLQFGILPSCKMGTAWHHEVFPWS